MLNLIACGLVMRPVPIEPAEVAKQNKKDIALKKQRKEKSKIFTKVEDQVDTHLVLDKEKEFYTENLPDEKQKKTLKDTIKSFIDFSLFYDFIFMFFAASNFLTSLGFNAPYIFIVDQATSLGIEPHKADILLSTIGLSHLIRLRVIFLRPTDRVKHMFWW